MKFNLSKLKTAAKPTAQDLENQLRAELAPLAPMLQNGEITQKDIYRLLGTTIKNYQNEIIAEELERFRKPVQDLTRQISKLKPDYDPSEILSTNSSKEALVSSKILVFSSSTNVPQVCFSGSVVIEISLNNSSVLFLAKM